MNENQKPHFRETDGLYPNSPLSTPSQQPDGPSPLMNMVPWPRKPVGKAKGNSQSMAVPHAKAPSRGKSKSGLHKLGKVPKVKSWGYYG